MKRKSLIALLLSLILCVTMCAGTFAEERQSELPLSTTGEELTIYCAMNAQQASVFSDLSEHSVVKKIEEETGLKLKFMHPPVNDDGTFFNTTIASGEWPDLFYTDMFFNIYPGGVEGAMDDGILINVDDLVAKYGTNFLKTVDEYDAGTGYITNGIRGDSGAITRFGSMFLAPYVDGRVFYGPLVRKDWMDKYGLELPVTLDEYTEVLRTFKANGVQVPLALCNIFNQTAFWQSNLVASAFGVTYNDFQVKDGKVVYSMLLPEYRDMLEFLHGWAEEGLIDRDSVNRTLDDCLTVFENGTAGMIITHNANTTTIMKVGESMDPDFKSKAIEFPRKNREDILTLARITHSLNSFSWQISSTCKNPELAVKFVDYLHDDDTRLMTAWGLGNEEYPTYITKEDGSREFSDFMNNNPTYDFTTARQLYTLGVFQVQYDDMMERQQYYLPEQLDNWEMWKINNVDTDKIPSLVSMTLDESRDYTDIMTRVNNYVEEQVYAFIFGDKSFDEYDAFVEQIKSLNIEKACEIKQAGYDRYMARQN